MAVPSSLGSQPLKALLISLLLAPTYALPSARQEAPIPDFTTSEAGNPFIEGWYADPDTEFYNGEYWVFPTWSDVYEKQTHMDAFSSPDLVHWTKHENIITADNVTWAHKAMWAPAAIERDGKYFLYFGANDILIDEIEEGLVGGIGVAVADAPEGPYVDAIGEPLIGDFYNGAQPIDQDVFIDDDGQAYIYYGGHDHCNVAKLNEDMISLGTFDDGTTFKEITPENYIEGAQMMKKGDVYYFFWSEGGWTGPDYSVSYAMADNPLGPFERLDNILKQDSAVARGSGHNGVIHVPGTEIYYITYHRRPLSETDGNHRESCYERLYFEEDGTIRPIEMLVKDNFADGNTNGWNMTGTGIWAVEGEKLKGASHDGLSLALLDTNFTDVKLEVKVSALAFSNDDTPYVIFRASDITGGDYYWARLKEDKVEVGITQGGEQTVLGEGAGTFESETEYSIRVLAVGNQIDVFVDDFETAVVSLTDDSLAIGADGVAVIGTATFDDVAVLRP